MSDPVPLAEFVPRSVVVINVDTLRADRLAAYGHYNDTMPFFQSRSGQVVASAWATSGWTPTSVPSLLTGLEVHGHGIVGVEGLEYQQVDGEQLQVWLGHLGFRTAFFSGNHVLPETSVVEGWEEYRLIDDAWSSNALVNGALSWLDQLGEGERFFMLLQPMDTHHPWMPPSEYQGVYVDYSSLGFPITNDADAQVEAVRQAYMVGSEEERSALQADLFSVYDEEVLGLDASLERLLVGLEERGVLDQTLVVLTADHGESLYDAPDQILHGGTLRQEIIGIPMIFYSPAIMSGGIAPGCIASTLDVFPTLMARLGVGVPDGISGIDLLSSCRAVAAAELFERPPDHDYLLTDVVAVSGAARLEHDCDRGERRSYGLAADPYGLVPVVGVTVETEPLVATLDASIDAVLARWPDQRCLGRE